MIAYVGTFEAYQGLEILLGAFAELRSRSPARAATDRAPLLLLVGGRDDQVQEAHEQASDHGLSVRVTSELAFEARPEVAANLDADVLLTGRVAQPLAKAYLRRASVVTSPRSRGTNTPLKVYELLALGKPIVATRILSHTQVLDDGVCILVEPDAESMADGLELALRGGERVEARVDAAKALYERRYSRAAYELKMRRMLEVLGFDDFTETDSESDSGADSSTLVDHRGGG